MIWLYIILTYIVVFMVCRHFYIEECLEVDALTIEELKKDCRNIRKFDAHLQAWVDKPKVEIINDIKYKYIAVTLLAPLVFSVAVPVLLLIGVVTSVGYLFKPPLLPNTKEEEISKLQRDIENMPSRA